MGDWQLYGPLYNGGEGGQVEPFPGHHHDLLDISSHVKVAGVGQVIAHHPKVVQLEAVELLTSHRVEENDQLQPILVIREVAATS